ncbi:hypothetical protein NCCP2140_31810 [Pseudoalteromonas sp. NCCP-2140]|uniref:BNR-4 repeat-containing protein n=1 Tax=Pseudoalteromonas sp. NCCP-2140 TaxID=2942288 RepID=UPI00204221D5|nr:BNR-4 repeat-containing protein [Pseudoalteromonas sp. NCCP-2140]GKW54128.1 hypothetical protein NCCP2140_31810 [Pseudoalteromonas sp. NCCP-2140]
MLITNKYVHTFFILLLITGCNSESQNLTDNELTANITQKTQVDDKVTTFAIDDSNRAGWWKPITSNENTLYVAFNSEGELSSNCENNSTHYVTVAYKNNDENWQYLNALKQGKLWRDCDDYGHKQPSIAVDGNGVIHLFSDMHNDIEGCCYFNNLQSTEELELKYNFKNQGRFTYPIATTSPTGDIYLIVRNLPQIIPSADIIDYEGAGELYMWKHQQKKWHKVATFAENTKSKHAFDAPVYPDDIYIDSYGVIHILWQWSVNTTSDKRYYGSYITYNEDAQSFYFADGSLITPPVSLESIQSHPSMIYESSSPNKNTYIQMAKLVVDDTYCSPCIAYREINASTHQIKLTRWEQGEWSKPEVVLSTSNNTTFATLDITTDEDSISIYYAVKSEGAYVIKREFTSSTWQSELLQSSSAEDIRLSVISFADKLTLYLSSLVNEQQLSELLIQPID